MPGPTSGRRNRGSVNGGDLGGLVDVDRGMVSREIFVSETIYGRELERVFARAWLFLGRFVAAWMSDAIGRRWSGMLIGFCAALTLAVAGYAHDIYVGTVSVFFLLVLVNRFFGDGSYAIIGPYMAEVWPARLRASGMGFGYGVGNLGKIIGPLGLALIAGASDYISPKATLGALGPALLFLAFWYAQAAVAFWLLGFETKGRSFEEIDAALASPVKPRAV
jgi:MFS transporter, putative metabolite:H+ symporter